MIQCDAFFKLLNKNSFKFFTGIPDSLLKNLCAFITDQVDSNHHIIAANEGNAVAIAAGQYLATGKPAVVYLQNSGLGNTVNPLTSLAASDVYSIPILLIIGWRAGPGVADEPQHKQMGRIQNDLLKTLEIPYAELGDSITSAQIAIKEARQHFQKNKSPFAILVRKNTFADYSLKKIKKTNFPLSREKALEAVIPLLGKNDIVVSTTGKTSRELFELREKRGAAQRGLLRTESSGRRLPGGSKTHEKDFLCVGNMGHTSSLALGIALAKPNKKVWCFDGDGSMIMHLGATAIIAQMKPKNFIHVVFNNFAHDSVGGQPTAADTVDFPKIAKACGYHQVFSVKTKLAIKKIVVEATRSKGPIFIEIKCNKGSRADLGRPTKSPKENKQDFMTFIK